MGRRRLTKSAKDTFNVVRRDFPEDSGQVSAANVSRVQAEEYASQMSVCYPQSKFSIVPCPKGWNKGTSKGE